MKKPYHVRVTWYDACSFPPWVAHEDAKKYELERVESAGWLVHVDRKRVIIALSKVDSDHSLGDVMVIPKHSVTKIVRYR